MWFVPCSQGRIYNMSVYVRPTSVIPTLCNLNESHCEEPDRGLTWCQLKYCIIMLRELQYSNLDCFSHQSENVTSKHDFATEDSVNCKLLIPLSCNEIRDRQMEKSTSLTSSSRITFTLLRLFHFVHCPPAGWEGTWLSWRTWWRRAQRSWVREMNVEPVPFITPPQEATSPLFNSSPLSKTHRVGMPQSLIISCTWVQSKYMCSVNHHNSVFKGPV